MEECKERFYNEGIVFRVDLIQYKLLKIGNQTETLKREILDIKTIKNSYMQKDQDQI